MQRGDVAFYAPDPSSAIDRVIIKAQSRAGYAARFVHCEMALDDRFLVGAVWPVVRVGPLGKLTPAAIVTPPWQSAAGPDRAADYLVSQIGHGYNVVGVGALGVSLIVPAWKDALMHDTAAFSEHLKFCSQLVVNALLADGVVPPDPAAATGPQALADWLQVA